ncbi:hypothetical protein ID866_4183 [Astraeus odoratus]|nr:hypothetical protein ID866_4183 [Astraeus odoratus]
MLFCIPKRFLTPTTTSGSIIRTHSTSPYGQSHLRKKHPRPLPAPVVPHFPQHVTRADGSTFTHWTTSPRSRIVLTRDTTNHPLWNATERICGGSAALAQEEEEEGTGRMRRWKRKFGDDIGVEQWSSVQEGVETEKAPSTPKDRAQPGKSASTKTPAKR